MTAHDLIRHIEVLSSPAFGGRGPATPGETLTTDYLIGQFQALGLEPGNGGSFLQEVPLVEITASPDSTLVLEAATGAPTSASGRDAPASSLSFRYGTDFMSWTKRLETHVSLERSDLVFVGYGVVAPEHEWNDYEGLDVRGKTVVILVNDPGFGSGDPALFRGREMTYYGRWTYKFDEAARQGAAGALIVHETEPAGYPWEVVSTSNRGPRFSLKGDGSGPEERVAVEGWLTLEAARSLFEAAGEDYDALGARAAKRGFRAVTLALQASTEVRSTIRHTSSNNVLALLPGTSRPGEVVVYMAHWDHLGTDGGRIYHGAQDNASGVAAILEIARLFTALDPRPARSVLFLSVTAEEQGLLGSAYYADHPVFPPDKTVAAINIDGLNTFGPTRDLTVVGMGQSELEDYLGAAAAAEGRTLRPDPEPEKGFYYRSDHFNFARVGVPALYTDTGVEHLEHGEAWMREQRERWTKERYHKPADVIDESWDLEGAVSDLRILYAVGRRVAEGTDFPGWREGSEFRRLRESAARRVTR